MVSSVARFSWCITESNLPYADIFFSPNFRKISITPTWSWNKTEPPFNILSTFSPTISTLPTSNLQILSVHINHYRNVWRQFKGLSSFIILRCVPSLTEYDTTAPLSDAAVNHLLHLPHLRTLCTHGPPPDYSATSLPLVFPPIERLTFGQGAARGWLSLLERLEDRASTAQVATPLSKAKESLKVLNIKDNLSVYIDTSLISPIQSFRNLIDLDVRVYCHYENDLDRCIFELSNGNVTELAMALTQLGSLLLGNPCFKNTCSTTVACLLPISAYCAKLEKLETHFSTTNIVDDFKDIQEDPRFEQLRSVPKCPLVRLDVYEIPLTLDEPGSEVVANGMIDIFPSLTRCEGVDKSWEELSNRIVRNKCSRCVVCECSSVFTFRLIHPSTTSVYSYQCTSGDLLWRPGKRVGSIKVAYTLSKCGIPPGENEREKQNRTSQTMNLYHLCVSDSPVCQYQSEKAQSCKELQGMNVLNACMSSRFESMRRSSSAQRLYEI